jgi:uncharacterized membrane protein
MSPDTASDSIVISPNASMSCGQMCVFLLSMFLVSSMIALGFAWVGLWLVLPFAGLEMLVLAVAFYSVLKKSQCREVVYVDHDNVTVQSGRRGPEQQCIFLRAWTQVQLVSPSIRGYPSRLLLRCGGRQVEIGACLTEDEREALGERLNQILSPADQPLVAVAG